MEVITMESDTYKRLMSKIEQIADFVAEAKLPSEEKEEAWLDSNQLTDALGISTRTLQRLRDDNLISYSMLRGRCMHKLSEVERCLEERTIRCKPGNLEEFRRNYLNRTGHDKNSLTMGTFCFWLIGFEVPLLCFNGNAKALVLLFSVFTDTNH